MTDTRTLRDPARDIGILLAQIEWLQECLGESLEAEDASLVDQIRADWIAQPALLDAHTAAQPAPDAVAEASSEPCIICGSPHMTRGEMTLPDGRWVCSRPCELAAEAVRKAKDATEFRNLATGSRP